MRPLKHTLPGKSPRPSLLSVVTSRSCSNSALPARTKPLDQASRTGRGEFFLDRRQQGSWRGAYKDVFTACPERTHRSLAPATNVKGSVTASPGKGYRRVSRHSCSKTLLFLQLNPVDVGIRENSTQINQNRRLFRVSTRANRVPSLRLPKISTSVTGLPLVL